VCELLELPRAGLARRFGLGLLDALDRALGRAPDPQVPFIAPECFSSRLELPAPAWEAQALLFAAKRLTAALTGWLLGRGLGVMRLNLALIHEDCAPIRSRLICPRLAATPTHLNALAARALGANAMLGRVEAIVLQAEETARLTARNFSLLPGSATAEITSYANGSPLGSVMPRSAQFAPACRSSTRTFLASRTLSG